MKCACAGEPGDLSLCELHKREFENRLAAGRIEPPKQKQKQPKYLATVCIESLKRTGDSSFSVVFKGALSVCVEMDFMVAAEGVPSIGAKYSLTLEPTDG